MDGQGFVAGNNLGRGILQCLGWDLMWVVEGSVKQSFLWLFIFHIFVFMDIFATIYFCNFFFLQKSRK